MFVNTLKKMVVTLYILVQKFVLHIHKYMWAGPNLDVLFANDFLVRFGGSTISIVGTYNFRIQELCIV